MASSERVASSGESLSHRRDGSMRHGRLQIRDPSTPSKRKDSRGVSQFKGGGGGPIPGACGNGRPSETFSSGNWRMSAPCGRHRRSNSRDTPLLLPATRSSSPALCRSLPGAWHGRRPAVPMGARCRPGPALLRPDGRSHPRSGRLPTSFGVWAPLASRTVSARRTSSGHTGSLPADSIRTATPRRAPPSGPTWPTPSGGSPRPIAGSRRPASAKPRGRSVTASACPGPVEASPDT
jgi:hypothetical protein